MINDPLIPQSHGSAPTVDRAARTTSVKDKKSRRRPPARSAKILAVGLSTTAMLGMTTGYAFADFSQKQQVPPTDPTSTETAAGISSGGTAPVAPATVAPSAPPAVVTPSQVSPPAPAPVAPQQEVVIELPAPQAGNGSSNWNNQKSSGSN